MQKMLYLVIRKHVSMCILLHLNTLRSEQEKQAVILKTMNRMCISSSYSVKMASQQQQPQPVGPMAQPGLQQPSALQQLSQQQDFDPVHRFKMLIPQLKESLQVNTPTANVAFTSTPCYKLLCFHL